MQRPSWLAQAILILGGIVLILGGTAAIAVGLLNPGLISSQLPPDAEVDAPAVGGAAFALGVATLLLGIVHIGTAIALGLGIMLSVSAGKPEITRE